MKISGWRIFEDCVAWKCLEKEARVRQHYSGWRRERCSLLLGAEYGSCRGGNWEKDGTGKTETSHHSSR